jgi:hypothetical protein
MSPKNSWSRKPHFSIGGIEVVPATGLEIPFDSSPEVSSEQGSEEEKNFVSRRHGNINWRRKAFGLPIFWVGIGITAFVVGIVTGGIIVSGHSLQRKVIKGTKVRFVPINIHSLSLQESSASISSNPTVSSPIGSRLTQPSVTAASQSSSLAASSISIAVAASGTYNAAQTSLSSTLTTSTAQASSVGGVSVANFQVSNAHFELTYEVTFVNVLDLDIYRSTRWHSGTSRKSTFSWLL